MAATHLFTKILLVLIIFVLLAVPVAGGYVLPQENEQGADENDINVFMSKVLEHRSTNWEQLNDYIFSEREEISVEGNLEGAPLFSFRRVFNWFVRDGVRVRSLVSINGIPLPEDLQARTDSKAQGPIVEFGGARSSEEDSRDNFIMLSMDNGSYYFAGRKKYKGREVVVIEYFPDVHIQRKGDYEDKDDYYERAAEKALEAELYVIPEEHQIVRMTIKDVDFDFLPGRWLVRVSNIDLIIEMEKPLGEIWMPTLLSGEVKLSTAKGDLLFRYRKEYFDYSKVKVNVKFKYVPESGKSQNEH